MSSREDEESQERMKKNVDKNRRKEVFEKGVLLSIKDFDLAQFSSRICRKLG
jgi:hypothetical protein